ncbi:MAG: T9SS type A sorting domain-containing protein [Ignavibacteria bacterium]|nr:T9SS type A sorting domain-containing protein [Ignavibacteria bacterium]
MKKILSILLLVISFTINTFSQSWFMQEVSPGAFLQSVKFTSGTNGYCAGPPAVIYKTTNGGASWFSQNTNHQGYLNDIYFPNQNTGYAVGELGDVVKTTNAGQSWTITDVSSTTYFGVTFIDATTGFICGFESILKTSNGGALWYPVSTNLIGTLHSISFLPGNPSVLYCCGTNGILAKSIDYGETWVQQSSGSSYNFQSINVYAPGSVMVVGEGKIMRTVNGGENWLNSPHSPPTYFRCVQMINSTTGFAAGHSGHILKTYNGGLNWFQLAYYENFDFSAMHFVDASTGYFTRDDGRVIKTTNGGGTPIGLIPVSNDIPKAYSLSQNYPNPFNPTTNIKFAIPQTGLVKLTVFDMLGREIETLVNENLNAGTYNADWVAANYPSGVYFYKLTSAGYSVTKRMVLVK